MRYVGIAALVATFWLSVATVRLLIYDDCAYRQEAAEVPAMISAPTPAWHPPAPAPAPTSEAPRYRSSGCDCEAGLCGGEIKTPRRHEDDFPSGRHGPISKAAVVAGMNGIRPRIAACYQRYQVPGTALVNVVIATSGRVSSATVTGKFAGTPTGACVEKAAKTARFPPSDGLATPYPFQLR